MEKKQGCVEEKKKEYLKLYKQAVLAAKLIGEEIEQLRMDKMHPSAHFDGMPRSNNFSDLSEYAAMLDKKIREQQEARYRRITIYSDIVARIEEMEDETQRNLLRLKYIHCKTWEEVCEEVGYSNRQIHNIHKKALQNFQI